MSIEIGHPAVAPAHASRQEVQDAVAAVQAKWTRRAGGDFSALDLHAWRHVNADGSPMWTRQELLQAQQEFAEAVEKVHAKARDRAEVAARNREIRSAWDAKLHDHMRSALEIYNDSTLPADATLTKYRQVLADGFALLYPDARPGDDIGLGGPDSLRRHLQAIRVLLDDRHVDETDVERIKALNQLQKELR